MEIMIVNPSQVSLTNKKLAQATTRIFKLGDKVRSNLYEIAKELVKIDEADLYKDDGFKSVTEYAQSVLGIKKTLAYNLVRIGREYTAPELPGSNLPHEDNDYTVAQIERLLPVTHDEAVELINEGKVNSEMSTREIAKVVKEYRKAKKDDTEAKKDDTEAKGESETEDETTAEAAEENDRERAIQKAREAIAALVPYCTGKVALKRLVSSLVDEAVTQ